MTILKDYQRAALRTESHPSPVIARLAGIDWGTDEAEGQRQPVFPEHAKHLLRLLHASLGITSDLNEYVNATDDTNRVEELGDIYWFLAIGFDAIGTVLTVDQIQVQANFDQLVASYVPASEIDGSTSVNEASIAFQYARVRAIQYLAGEFACKVKAAFFYNKTQQLAEKVLPLLDGIAQGVEALCFYHGLDSGDVRAANITKLKARFPKAYDEQAAQNRDVEAERKSIEDVIGKH